MLSYNWVGHVCELKNIIEKAVLLCKNTKLTTRDLEIEEEYELEKNERSNREISFPPLSSSAIDLPSVLKSLEQYYFKKALEMTSGNESQAAKLLNMNHHTFRYRWKKLQSK